MGYDKFKTEHCGAKNGDGYSAKAQGKKSRRAGSRRLVKAILAAWLRGYFTAAAR